MISVHRWLRHSGGCILLLDITWDQELAEALISSLSLQLVAIGGLCFLSAALLLLVDAIHLHLTLLIDILVGVVKGYVGYVYVTDDTSSVLPRMSLAAIKFGHALL